MRYPAPSQLKRFFHLCVKSMLYQSYLRCVTASEATAPVLYRAMFSSPPGFSILQSSSYLLIRGRAHGISKISVPCAIFKNGAMRRSGLLAEQSNFGFINVGTALSIFPTWKLFVPERPSKVY